MDEPHNHYFLFYYIETAMVLGSDDELDGYLVLKQRLSECPRDPVLLQMMLRLLKHQGKDFEDEWAGYMKTLLLVDPCASIDEHLKSWIRYTNGNDSGLKSWGADTLEILASRIEFGDGENEYIWKTMADIMSTIRDFEPGLDEEVWSHRRSWWPRYHFNQLPKPGNSKYQ